MKVSVIIPCYNMKSYLPECLESILNQKLQNIEVICVDDGSTDGSVELVEQYQHTYKNIMLIKQKHQGAGYARNRGICMAGGEFIAFMDADDFYPNDQVLEMLYYNAKKQCASICGGAACIYDEREIAHKSLQKKYIFEEECWISKEEFPTPYGYWRFIYRKDFLQQNEICFPNYLRYQDPPFFLKALAEAKKVYCMKEVVYCYRKARGERVFSHQQAVDYVKGMRDCLVLAKGCMPLIYNVLKANLFVEASALIYLYAVNKSEGMMQIAEEINEIISEKNGRKLYEGDKIIQYVDECRKEKEKLFEFVRKENKILVFGAGYVAGRISNFFRSNEIAIEAFVVSDEGKNVRMIDGVEVRCIDEFISCQAESVVVVATLVELHKEIEQLLVEKGFSNIFFADLEKLFLWKGEVVY